MEQEEVVAITLTESKLTDGNIISYETLEIGSVINMITSDGTLIPLPMGEYELEDGTKITVEVEGVIASVLAKEQMDEMTPAPGRPQETLKPTIETIAKGLEDLTEKINQIDSLSTRISALETLIAEATGMEELSSKVNEIDTSFQSILEILGVVVGSQKTTDATITELSKEIKEIAVQPSTKPVFVESSKKTSKTDSLIDRINNLKNNN